MRYLKWIMMVLLVLKVSSASADVIGETDKEVKRIANPILDSILEGFGTNNYQKYSRNFDDTLKEAISEKKFLETAQQIKAKIGNYQSREYLGFLKKGRMTLVLWKASFDKSEDNVLIKLVISKRKSKYLVTGLWFQ